MSLSAVWKRFWWLPVLMLSLGINVGLVTGRVLPSLGETDRTPAAEGPAGAEVSGSGAEGRSGLPRPWRRALQRLATDFGLEGEARSRFMAAQQEFFQRSQDGRVRLHRARAELRRELSSSEPDRERSESLVREVAAAQQDLELAFVDNYFQTRALVGPGQEERFLRFMGRIRDARRELLERRSGTRRSGTRR